MAKFSSFFWGKRPVYYYKFDFWQDFKWRIRAKKMEKSLSDDLGKNLENSRRKKGQYTSVNLIFVDFWWKIWILSDEWGHFFISVKKADNGLVFWKDTFHFLVTKIRYTSVKVTFDEKRAMGEGTFGAICFFWF